MSDARARVPMSDNEIVDYFSRFGFRVLISQIIFTTETIDDFREARTKKWWKTGKLRRNELGLLEITEAQPRPDQRTRDIIIVSFGGARVVLGVDIKPGSTMPLPGDASRRYAQTMEWAVPAAKPKAVAVAAKKKRA